MTVAQVVEAITNDLQRALEDASYGVSAVVTPIGGTEDSDRKKVMIGALGGLAAALGRKGLGI